MRPRSACVIGATFLTAAFCLAAGTAAAQPDPVDGIRRSGEHERVMRRRVRDALLDEGAGPLLSTVRLIPHHEAGQVTGMKVYAVRPRSVFAALGFLNGDEIRSVQGRPVNTPDGEARLQSMFEHDDVTVEVWRRGRMVSLHWRVVDRLPRGTTPAITARQGRRQPRPFPPARRGGSGQPVPRTGRRSEAGGEAVQNGITQRSSTEFDIQTEALEGLLTSSDLARQARIVPHTNADGEVDGLRLYGVRPDSIAHALGIRNGDTLRSVNGQALDSPESALDAYAHLRTARVFHVAIERRGRPLTLEYRLVD